MRIQDVSHLETENLEKWVSFALLTRYLKIHTVRPLQIAEMAKAGSSLPPVVVKEGTPGTDVKITDLFKGKKGILFGVPGAFTPVCSSSHLPGYVGDYDKLTKAGAEVIACLSINDAFVMAAWGTANGSSGKVRMLADQAGELTKALGVELDSVDMLGNVRCKRFSAVIVDNVIKTMNVEDNSLEATCSMPDTAYKQLSQLTEA
ncbi:hypothetical protein WJX79_010515 [Trebouxia sp. C0005]|nr:MAG: peroxiredoxin- mitochondrial-like [Trebouxia sp. A1-2]